jgi:predicted metalloprotease with PDZ domain
MINYSISFDNPSNQYITVKINFTSTEKEHEIQLPSWRPGRYELGNFAKNVKSFTIYENNQPISFQKITKDRWKFTCLKNESISVEYKYYANELNAGSTFLSDNQLYVNPVNCCAYIHGKQNEPFTLQLDIPTNYQIACGLEKNENTLSGNSFDELADSPLICSPTLKHNTYESNNTLFNIWFQGEVKPQWDKIITDFKKFTDKQIEKFGDFPVKEYHFLIQISPYRTYHGVEHKTSTVIHLGPSIDILGDFYSDLLGVSSHELYHTWNVKSIRPIEMFPYDFTKENYSELGYLCEGVTTYMGDLMLLKSGVFSLEEYLKEMETQIQKHLDNDGRNNYSVANSSFDTWLDGYVPGAPGRKVSIYTEGCLLTFILDVKIIKNSNGKHSFDDVMCYLYNEFYKNNKGVSKEDYKNAIEKFALEDLTEFWSKYIDGFEPIIQSLKDSFSILGLKLEIKENNKLSAERIGIKTIFNGTNHVVKNILVKSYAEITSLTIEDEIVAINSYEIKNELDKWLDYFSNEKITLLIKRKGRFLNLDLHLDGNNSFVKNKILVNSSNNPFFEKWTS